MSVISSVLYLNTKRIGMYFRFLVLQLLDELGLRIYWGNPGLGMVTSNFSVIFGGWELSC